MMRTIRCEWFILIPLKIRGVSTRLRREEGWELTKSPENKALDTFETILFYRFSVICQCCVTGKVVLVVETRHMFRWFKRTTYF